MEFIVLKGIEKTDRKIQYSFDVSEGLKCYFSEPPFVIEYPDNIETIPDAVAAVPFVCNVLPIIWITDSKLVVPELDEAFFQCIPAVKKGYETMYPETDFLGSVEVAQVVNCNRQAIPGKCAMFFSGGVDSLDTLYRHLDEAPSLISIWGSDIKYDNVDGWLVLQSTIQDAAQLYGLPTLTIHSSFREFDNEYALTKMYSVQLKDSWWHGVKHGIALLGHVAPYAYLYNLEKMYIASSHCAEDGHVRCASNPLIDNHVRFVNCEVVHDGFSFSRQDKIRNIVQYSREHKTSLPLHVCWETQEGSNCCHCEKCYRTIIAILAEGGDPAKAGFPHYAKFLKDVIPVIKKEKSGVIARQWPRIQQRFLQEKEAGKRIHHWRKLRWMKDADFYNPDSFRLPLYMRLKAARGLRAKLGEFRFYQKLHAWKVIIMREP